MWSTHLYFFCLGKDQDQCYSWVIIYNHSVIVLWDCWAHTHWLTCDRSLCTSLCYLPVRQFHIVKLCFTAFRFTQAKTQHKNTSHEEKLSSIHWCIDGAGKRGFASAWKSWGCGSGSQKATTISLFLWIRVKFWTQVWIISILWDCHISQMKYSVISEDNSCK